ncbi:MAG: GNAT family N-acetyltransferase [Chitinophagales bacterium]|nr:GNAT family N-acetyltransferase [Chitinophagales bacterium]
MQQQINTIETERLVLNEITPKVHEYIMSHYDDDAIMKFFGHSTVKELMAEKERFMQGVSSYYFTFRRFTMVDKATGITIGQCGFHKWYTDHAKAEFGYALNNDEVKNKGFMTEAAKAIVAYGFEKMELNRIEAFASPANEPSIRLLKSLGFTYEGLMREHYYKNGLIEDSACYSLLKREYKP